MFKLPKSSHVQPPRERNVLFRLLYVLGLAVALTFVLVVCFGLWYANVYEGHVFNGAGHNRPTGIVVFAGPERPGTLRFVHIEHSHGVVSTIVTYYVGLHKRVDDTDVGELDQRPPEGAVDVAGQWVMDRYNEIKCNL